MSKKVCAMLVATAVLFITVLISFAHPGRTDSNGGHYDRSTGEYHYHHGYPAHQHPNGVCPYDFDDKTGSRSGSSRSSGSSSSATSSTASFADLVEQSKSEEPIPLPLIILKILLAIIVLWLLIVPLISYFAENVKNKISKK